MDRRKQLLMEYKLRKPEMGIVAYRCIPTQEIFLGLSKDTKATMNSNSFSLDANSHYNKILQNLWKQYGRDNFEIFVLKVLPYGEEEKPDYTEDLEDLLAQSLTEIENAKKLK